MISVGPYVEEHPHKSEFPSGSSVDVRKWISSQQQGAKEEVAKFLATQRIPAYGGDKLSLIDIRQHGYPDSTSGPIGFMWTCGRGATHLDQDKNRFVKDPDTVFWLREASNRTRHRDMQHFASVLEVARVVLSGFSLWIDSNSLAPT